tara:strand:+ start:600 stop:1313 length:714 start_codon:yes stop_codon:yes gene_type:complete
MIRSSIQGPQVIEFTVNENFHSYLDATSFDGSFRSKLYFPDNLINSDVSKYKHCPEFEEGERVVGLGPLMDDSGSVFYMFIGGRLLVPISTDCTIGDLIITEVQDGSAGASGSRGEDGTIGFLGAGAKGQVGATGNPGDRGSKGAPGESITGDKGSKGSSGEAGEAGAKGATGATGTAGDKGGDGDKGAKGDEGDPLDWNSTQESILIGGTKFGPRLIGVCRNGTYEYVYVFASDPQ